VIRLDRADPRYPRALLDLGSPPDPVWVEGDATILGRRAISIVGTRRMSPYGARIARELASTAAQLGVIVVSGLAQGIDSVGHEAALESRGATIAVLGAGLPRCLQDLRGRRHVLARGIAANGALVSEFPPQAPPQTWTFAQRNATIAALGEFTIVVEAPSDSGALITAAYARRLGRGVYAVPGPVGASGSEGTNGLIASGHARALIGSAMLRELLGQPRGAAAPAVMSLDARLLDALAAGPLDADTLARSLGLAAPALATVIARLVIRGAITSAPDGRLVRR